jgi:E3 ubiquitin-protein ligase HUWE1
VKLLITIDDEDMYHGEYEDEMDYEEEEVDAEDNISDEDEEIDGMGPIEGLSGDNVDVEVIMDDDDDDDDDDDGSSEDDEDDSEDEEAHAEIQDEIEDGQGIDADDMDDWESDNEDVEEDYEGHADDHEAHDRQVMDDMERASGQLGHIVRALGGEDAVDIMERMEEQMEAEGMDQADDDDDNLVAEYVEEGDEEGQLLHDLLVSYPTFHGVSVGALG